jgi:hypothetical protein
MTPRSMRAINNLRAICDDYLAGLYDLDVIDIYQQPALAKGEQIIAAPTLIKTLPMPMRRIIGDMSNRDGCSWDWISFRSSRLALRRDQMSNNQPGFERQAEWLPTDSTTPRPRCKRFYSGEIDALIVAGPDGDRVYTLHSAEEPYRNLVEQMQEGAVVLTGGGDILYANARFAVMVGEPLESVVGSRMAHSSTRTTRRPLPPCSGSERKVPQPADWRGLRDYRH